MKKPLITLLLVLAVCACEKDEQKKEPQPPYQEYTSFVVFQPVDNLLNNCVAGYYDEQGYCKKIGDLGDIKKGEYSNEITIGIDTVPIIYVFTDYISPRKLDTVFVLKRNIKNVFALGKITKGINVDKSNPYEYPH
jgi:hypothetical protein